MKFEDGYECDLKPRYRVGKGHPIIEQLLTGSLPRSRILLESFKQYEASLSLLPMHESEDSTEFFWDNDFLPALDALTLYGFLTAYKPATYLEIGSGFSTKIARYASKEEGLQTKICSIDPSPRAEIDQICDAVERKRLEDVESEVFEKLQPNDILFFDGSHRALTNSDVTVFFCDILPIVKPGVLIQIHDIPWPEDYPAEWSSRCYNEQYMLAVLLIYAGEKLDILMPNAHVSRRAPVVELFPATIGRPELDNSKRGGCSFWFTKKARQSWIRDFFDRLWRRR